MAVLCSSEKLLFIMVPGTGCSVVGNYLIEHFDWQHLPEFDIVFEGKVIVDKKHNTISELLEHGLLTPELMSNYFSFATVRNPYDRLVTYYQRFVGGWMEEYFKWTNREYVRLESKLNTNQLQEWRKWQVKMIKVKKRRIKLAKLFGFNMWFIFTIIKWRLKGYSNASDSFFNFLFPMLNGVKYVIRYEKLPEGLDHVLLANEIDHCVDLPVANQTHGKHHYTTYYNWVSKLIGSYVMKKALRDVGYDFNGPIDSRLLIDTTTFNR